MTHEKNNTAVRRDDDSEGIDLIDAVAQIWHAKWIVIIFVIIALAVAGAYLSTAKQKWSSTAIITMPTANQIADYSAALRILSDDSELRTLDIQQQVIERFGASLSIFAEALPGQGDSGVLAVASSVPGQALPLRVTFQATSASEAQQKLKQYIQQVDESVRQDLNKELEPSIKIRSQELQTSLATQEKVAQEQKALRLQQISQALLIARDANVVAPQLTQAQDLSQDTLFLLGSSALASMIKNEASQPLALSDKYFKTRQTLMDIQNISFNPDEMHTYRYVMEPDLPLHRDGPKLRTVLAIAALLGAMLGAAFVLARHAIRSYTRRA
ncbi:LPS O-antigen chain length determinant protein WzzB [Kosakonia sp.]|uniref:LPS O-antigen chain length determinant protein WzzB n=1 Tax=Kosakonia sp. TaxID=1916651 RepID=UPI00289A2C8C|nr:LPS O-antigen chain length determinant protein WzzB [Kosakonia sp.]